MAENINEIPNKVIEEQYRLADDMASRLAVNGLASAIRSNQQQGRLEHMYSALDKAEKQEEESSSRFAEIRRGEAGSTSDEQSQAPNLKPAPLTRKERKRLEKDIVSYRHQKIYGSDAHIGMHDSLSERRRAKMKSALSLVAGKSTPAEARQQILEIKAAPIDLAEPGRKHTSTDRQKKEVALREELAHISKKKAREITDTEIIAASNELARRKLRAIKKKTGSAADEALNELGGRDASTDDSISANAERAVNKLHEAAYIENQERDKDFTNEVELAHHVGNLANAAYDAAKVEKDREDARNKALEHEVASKGAVDKLESDLLTELEYVDDQISKAIQATVRKKSHGGMLSRAEFTKMCQEIRSNVVSEYLGNDATDEEISDFETKLARFTYLRANGRRSRR